ncbi:hypothetical protein LEP1GSC151_5408 [Leptospira interrogans serovar Grippotyphosa str. LT2186]|uniref:Uncharacterized protein n=1 Tax=Leptospira interrogans serovar Grippotyphosa str. LT2186 TaxID=1001599 RepID=M3I482_LEPIR|nr:hypothetical protein LEP1GSC151_5408 [Leptospira interrogans serovar Grippotyphosa str. LT2186]
MGQVFSIKLSPLPQKKSEIKIKRRNQRKDQNQTQKENFFFRKGFLFFVVGMSIFETNNCRMELRL